MCVGFVNLPCSASMFANIKEAAKHVFPYKDTSLKCFCMGYFSTFFFCEHVKYSFGISLLSKFFLWQEKQRLFQFYIIFIELFMSLPFSQ